MAYMSWKIAFHASHSRSNDHAALTELVDGSTVASIYEDFGIFVVYRFKRMDNVFILHLHPPFFYILLVYFIPFIFLNPIIIRW